MQNTLSRYVFHLLEARKNLLIMGFSFIIGGTLYFFREGFNPSGNRFIAFVKDARVTGPGVTKARTEGFSMTLDGKDIRYFYREPSHHFWLKDEEIIDNPPEKQ
ncbi:MAG: hypothetical protein NTY07_15490 [Bacteroidia bacterium]|nr:hypothetical protein [Bacteroidia bacterium]